MQMNIMILPEFQYVLEIIIRGYEFWRANWK